jgi:hypothetical protein
MRATITILALTFAMSAIAAPPVDLGKLTKDQVIDGFTVASVYLNDADKPVGARFIHRRSGFTLDLLQIESVPQGHTWVNSFPVSDQGEPHTPRPVRPKCRDGQPGRHQREADLPADAERHQ